MVIFRLSTSSVSEVVVCFVLIFIVVLVAFLVVLLDFVGEIFLLQCWTYLSWIDPHPWLHLRRGECNRDNLTSRTFPVILPACHLLVCM